MQKNILDSSCAYTAQSLESAISPRKRGSFQWGRTKTKKKMERIVCSLERQSSSQNRDRIWGWEGSWTSESAQVGTATRETRLEKREHRQTCSLLPQLMQVEPNCGFRLNFTVMAAFSFFIWVLLEVCNVLPIKQIPTVSPGMEELQLSSWI